MKEQGEIDIQIIRKKVIEGLNSEEEKQLHLWNNTPLRQRYYKKAKYYYSKDKVHNHSTIKVFKTWEQVNKKLVVKKTYMPDWFKKLASVAAIFAIMLGSYVLIRQTADKPIYTQQIEEIKPGSKTAELILSDGTKIRLGGSDTVEETDGTIIQTGSEEISYQDDIPREKQSDLYNTLKLKKGEEFSLILSDGSKIWVNSMSAVRFPVHFNSNIRSIELLYGEACFKVAEDKSKPFIVKTPTHNIKVLGTTFNVSTYPDDATIKTTLAEGSVQINSNIDANNSVFIKPNQQFVYNKENQTTSVNEVNADAYISWTKGKFQFENESLEDIFTKLGRWYDIDVSFTNKNSRYEYFDGHLPRFENIQTLITMIEEVSDVSITLEGHTVVIK